MQRVLGTRPEAGQPRSAERMRSGGTDGGSREGTEGTGAPDPGELAEGFPRGRGAEGRGYRGGARCSGPAEERGVAAPSLCPGPGCPLRPPAAPPRQLRWGRTRASPGTFGSFPAARPSPGPCAPGAVRPGRGRRGARRECLPRWAPAAPVWGAGLGVGVDLHRRGSGGRLGPALGPRGGELRAGVEEPPFLPRRGRPRPPGQEWGEGTLGEGALGGTWKWVRPDPPQREHPDPEGSSW